MQQILYSDISSGINTVCRDSCSLFHVISFILYQCNLSSVWDVCDIFYLKLFKVNVNNHAFKNSLFLYSNASCNWKHRTKDCSEHGWRRKLFLWWLHASSHLIPIIFMVFSADKSSRCHLIFFRIFHQKLQACSDWKTKETSYEASSLGAFTLNWFIFPEKHCYSNAFLF